MADGERLGASFSIDVTALKAGLTQANRLIRESNSEFKAAAAGMDDWSKSEAGLTAKLKNLNDVSEIQAKKVEALQNEYDQCVADGMDPMSAAAVKMRTDINNEKAALEKTKSEIGKYSSALDEMRNATDDAGDAADDAADQMDYLGDSAEDSGEGFTIAKGAIADFIGNGLTALVGSCKDAISSIWGLAESTKESRTAFAKLEASFDSAGLGAEAAEKTMSDLYGVLGDTDKATEASNLIAKMSKDQKDLDKNTRILTGVFALYGESIPTEGLAEAMASTSAMSSVQGVLADALEWQGVNLDEYNEKLASMSTEEERSAYIQETLTGLYGEAADAYRENNAAMIEANEAQLEYDKTLNAFGEKIEPLTTKVKEGFNQILEKVLELVDDVDFDAFGDTIDKAFDKLINDILPKVVDAFQWIKDNGDVIIAVLGGIAAGFAAFKVASMITSVVSAIKAAGGALALLNTTMLASPITWVTVGVAALVAGIILLIKNWDKVKEAGAAAWEWIKGAWKTAAKWFNNTVIKPIAGIFSGVWNGIKDGAGSAWDGIKKTFSAVVGWFDKNIVQPFINSAFFKIVTELARGCWIAIQRIWEVVSAWFNTNVIQPLTQFFTNAWNAITNKAKAAWDGIASVWKAVSGWFENNVAAPVKDVFSAAWTKLKDGASKAWDGIKSVFSPVASFFGDVFSKAWEKVKAVFSVGGKIFDGIKDGIVSAFKTIVNAIIKGVNKVVAAPFNAINKALDTIRNISFLGISPFAGLLTRINVPQIPLLAKGGVVRRATNAIIGEDGAEAVVPLERNTEWIDKVSDKLASKQKAVIVNQTNNYSQAHSRYEIYKSKQQTQAAVRLALMGAK